MDPDDDVKTSSCTVRFYLSAWRQRTSFFGDAVENTVPVKNERSLRRSDWELGVPLLNQCFGSRELPDFHGAAGNPWSPSSRRESSLLSSSWSDVRAALQLRRSASVCSQSRASHAGYSRVPT